MEWKPAQIVGFDAPGSPGWVLLKESGSPERYLSLPLQETKGPGLRSALLKISGGKISDWKDIRSLLSLFHVEMERLEIYPSAEGDAHCRIRLRLGDHPAIFEAGIREGLMMLNETFAKIRVSEALFSRVPPSLPFLRKHRGPLSGIIRKKEELYVARE